MINRRGLITGLISLAAAPAIVRYGSLMPVKVVEPIINHLTLEDYIEKVLDPMVQDYQRQMMKMILNSNYGAVSILKNRNNRLELKLLKDYYDYTRTNSR